jgi:transposase-like protein
MKSLVDAAEFDIDCPNCRRKITQTIGKARSKTRVTCPSCGQGVTFDTREFDAAVKKIERELSKLGR